MQEKRLQSTPLGYGLGLRQPHYDHVMKAKPPVDWFEVLSENFMESHPGHWEFLGDLRAHYPLVMHGVGMNIAGTDPLDRYYLEKLKSLAAHVNPALISDHLCWTGAHGIHSHDLLPVPYTKEALAHVAERISRVQDALGRPLVLENPSTYAEFQASTMPEWEFLAQLAGQTGCGLLLDINNVYVSAFNHRHDAKGYLNAIPASSVAYLHLAGHRHLGTHIIDTHDDYIVEEVWQLYRHWVSRHGETPTLVEWDDRIPAFAILAGELEKAQMCARDVLKAAS